MKNTGTILLVEDDENILRTNRRILEQEGFTVLCAGTLGETQVLLESHKPDAMMLDIVALRAYLNGEDMMLSAREFSVLLFLLKNEGSTLSAAEIYKGAWDQPLAGSTSALWKCISRLKSKLAVCEGRVALMNLRNKGYLLEIIDI